MTINDPSTDPLPNGILAVMEHHDTMDAEISCSLIGQLVTVKPQVKGGYSRVENGNSRSIDAVTPKMIIECYLGLRGWNGITDMPSCNFKESLIRFSSHEP
jgi:hypothetical protein